MRIELPSASWADTALRAEDDAHTLTLAAQHAGDWLAATEAADPVLAVRTEVKAAEPLMITITF